MTISLAGCDVVLFCRRKYKTASTHGSNCRVNILVCIRAVGSFANRGGPLVFFARMTRVFFYECDEFQFGVGMLYFLKINLFVG